ncbi:MAG: hypothetical protein CMQ24_14820 [Gammaproteobacteria bacterium]|nr:hypothetical protein [Gammaproteobacteria bacterium]
MHIHLDLVGGMSGDMFIGAMLDLDAARAADLNEVMATAGFARLVELTSAPHTDGTLSGTRFKVIAAEDAEGHHHRHYSEIRRILTESALPDATREVSLGIFHLLAVAEAKVHAKEVDAVAFHEVGAWDSIADIVCAAHLIARFDASWSCGALPLGRGYVGTAHGRLPVPAPATALLLEGFEFRDDGLEGERITPTGAAILRWLQPAQTHVGGRQLAGLGYGFGTKTFPGISNVLRAVSFDVAGKDTVGDAPEAEAVWAWQAARLVSFEVDDQTAEELAVAADHLRAMPEVLDLTQFAAYGKKGRLVTSWQIVCLPEHAESVISAVFDQTTTIGLRVTDTRRAILERSAWVNTTESGEIRVKSVRRPAGETRKAEMADVAGSGGTLAERRAVRIDAERPKPGETTG